MILSGKHVGVRALPMSVVHNHDCFSVLLGRRERRRAKQAIVKPKEVRNTDTDGDDDAQETKSAKKPKKKGKPVGLAASLALMHGFSAKNVGSNRLTVCPRID